MIGQIFEKIRYIGTYVYKCRRYTGFYPNPTNVVFICDFIVVFSSKSCTRFLYKALSSPTFFFHMLAIDGTFKLNSVCWFSSFMCCYSRCFSWNFPYCFCASKSRVRRNDFFYLKTLMEAYNILYSKTLKIKYFMSDNAQYTFNAVSKLFGVLGRGHLNCYFHLK